MINFGIAKSQVSKMLSEQFLLDNNGTASGVYNEFLNTVKGSPILMLEYVVFKNLERNNFSKEEAIKYLDDNIALFESYSKKQILAENEKLARFCNDINDKSDRLSTAIQNLILESCIKTGIPNVNKIHDSFSLILESMTSTIDLTKEPEDETEEDESDENDEFKLNEVFKVAQKKIDEKLTQFDDEEKKIIECMTSDNEEDHKDLFESMKKDAINLLDSQEEQSETIKEAIEAINEKKYSAETLLEDVIAFYELLR